MARSQRTGGYLPSQDQYMAHGRPILEGSEARPQVWQIMQNDNTEYAQWSPNLAYANFAYYTSSYVDTWRRNSTEDIYAAFFLWPGVEAGRNQMELGAWVQVTAAGSGSVRIRAERSGMEQTLDVSSSMTSWTYITGSVANYYSPEVYTVRAWRTNEVGAIRLQGASLSLMPMTGALAAGISSSSFVAGDSAWASDDSAFPLQSIIDHANNQEVLLNGRGWKQPIVATCMPISGSDGEYDPRGKGTDYYYTYFDTWNDVFPPVHIIRKPYMLSCSFAVLAYAEVTGIKLRVWNEFAGTPTEFDVPVTGSVNPANYTHWLTGTFDVSYIEKYQSNQLEFDKVHIQISGSNTSQRGGWIRAVTIQEN